MKVLIILDKDGANLFIENIVRLLKERHEVRLFSTCMDDNSLRMFSDFSSEILSFNKCKEEDYNWADFIFAPVQPLGRLVHVNKYIFSFCNMNPLFDKVRGYDFVFTLNSPQDITLPYFASMPIGNPKNDKPQKDTLSVQKNKFLFIDSGHFPFGIKGKTQVAEMLLKICNNFPNYELCVKPRWLPGKDFSGMTHPNSLHIYDIINDLCDGSLPTNLNLLQEHVDMQELIDESSCVITLCSTAYLDVALREKPLVIVEGFDNDDMFQVRNYYFDDLYKTAHKTNCVVNYKDIISALPQGKLCDSNFINQVFSYKIGVSERALHVMEHIYDNYLKVGKYPSVKEYFYEQFKEELNGEESIDKDTILQNRFFSSTSNCLALNSSISNILPWNEYELEHMRMCHDCEKTKKGFDLLKKNVTKLKAQFLIDHSDFVMNDVDESYLYMAMYQLEQYNKILSLAEQNVHEIINFYAGVLYHKEEQYDLAKEYLLKYIEESHSRTNPKYSVDLPSSNLQAYLYLAEELKIAKDANNLFVVIKYAMECLEHYPEKEKNVQNILNKAGFTLNAAKWIVQSYNKQETTEKISVKKNNKSKKKCKNIKIFEKIKNFLKNKKTFEEVTKNIKNKIKKRLPNKLLKTLRFDYYYFKRVFHLYNKFEQDVLKYKNLYEGTEKACFIIGNGPSLTIEDLEKIQLKGFVTFASNKIYKLYSQTDWRPDYYVCIDELVFKQNRADIIYKNECPILLNSFFYKHVVKSKFVPKTILDRISYISYTFNKNKEHFYSQAANVESGGTVTFTMLELAWMMGFRKFYIIGCDHNYNTYNNLEENATQHVANSDTNKDYGIPNYMRAGEKMNVGNLDKATRGYISARKYIESHGGEIYNATRGGALETFERINIDEILC